MVNVRNLLEDFRCVLRVGIAVLCGYKQFMSPVFGETSEISEIMYSWTFDSLTSEHIEQRRSKVENFILT